MDKLKEKMIVKQSCLAFGAYEAAKKLSEDKEKLKILIDLLIEEDLKSTAYLIASNYFKEEELEEYSSDFQDVEKDDVSRNKVAGQLHQSLTGETILETKKRLRALKKEAAGQRKKEKKEGGAKTEKKEIPTHNRDGLEYLKLEEFNFNRENFFFVPTPRSFAKVKEHFLEQTLIGFDCEYFGHELSTITFASETLVAVFDIVSLAKNKDIIQYIKDIILSPEIEIVAHTFRTDAFVLQEALGIDPYKIENVLDLTEIVKEEGSDNRIGLQKMVQLNFEKALNQYYKRSNWEERPIQNEMIEYAALNAVVVLQIFKKFDKENPEVGIKYYDYDPPKGNPIMGRRKEAGKTKEKKATTDAKKPRRGGRRGQSRRGGRNTEGGKNTEGESTRKGGRSTRRNNRGGRKPANRDENAKDEDRGEEEKDTTNTRRDRTRSRRGRGRGRGGRGRGRGGIRGGRRDGNDERREEGRSQRRGRGRGGERRGRGGERRDEEGDEGRGNGFRRTRRGSKPRGNRGAYSGR